MPCAQIAMTSLRRLHVTFFFKHVIVNISSGLTRLIRRKCSLNRSKCVGTNHVILNPHFCCYINVTTRGAGLSPRDIHCFCLTTSFTYDTEERGRVSRTFQDWTFTCDVLFRKREDLQNRIRALESPEDTIHIIGRRHRSSLQCFTSTILVANFDRMGLDFRTHSS